MTLKEAHQHSSHNQQEIAASKTCGCFYCKHFFVPTEVVTWVEGDTALCPYCHIDSVIGDASGIILTPEFLDRMEKHWFGR